VLVRGYRREEATAAQVHEQEVNPEVPAQDLDGIFEEREVIPARVTRARERAPAASVASSDRSRNVA